MALFEALESKFYQTAVETTQQNINRETVAAAPHLEELTPEQLDQTLLFDHLPPPLAQSIYEAHTAVHRLGEDFPDETQVLKAVDGYTQHVANHMDENHRIASKFEKKYPHLYRHMGTLIMRSLNDYHDVGETLTLYKDIPSSQEIDLEKKAAMKLAERQAVLEQFIPKLTEADPAIGNFARILFIAYEERNQTNTSYLEQMKMIDAAEGNEKSAYHSVNLDIRQLPDDQDEAGVMLERLDKHVNQSLETFLVPVKKMLKSGMLPESARVEMLDFAKTELMKYVNTGYTSIAKEKLEALENYYNEQKLFNVGDAEPVHQVAYLHKQLVSSEIDRAKEKPSQDIAYKHVHELIDTMNAIQNNPVFSTRAKQEAVDAVLKEIEVYKSNGLVFEIPLFLLNIKRKK